jgi:tRNA(Ile)-lysidine synthase
MARLGPFEPHPTIAVAVSGGADSMALALLLAEWTAARDGRLDALTVDHGLRAESVEEARQVGLWLAGRPGVQHHILAWTGPKPARGLLEAAREARYRLLTEYCRDAAILHLCLAHHFDDQVETQAMRAARLSGPHGLAGMAAVRPLDGVRLLRPLLGVPKSVLQATLAARSQPWIEDPSNTNPAFERARLRAVHGSDDAGQQRARLSRLARARDRDEAAAAELLAARLTINPGGWAELDLAGLDRGAPEVRLSVAGVLRCIGGTAYPLSGERVGEVLAMLAGGPVADFTRGGCHLHGAEARLQVSRDWGAIQDVVSVHPGMSVDWDRRFRLAVAPDLGAGAADRGSEAGFTIARLGERGVQSLGAAKHPQHETLVGIPEPARKALPALWQGEILRAVPDLGFGAGLTSRFRPAQAPTSIGFTVAY